MKNRCLNATVLNSMLCATSLGLMVGCLEEEAEVARADTSGGGGTLVAPSSGGVPLAMEFPVEKVEGTPSPPKIPNLLPRPKKAPTVVVAEGTELLSRGKPVTSSDEFPIIGSYDLVTDGDKDTGEGYVLELSYGLQWVQVDLEESAVISIVWVWRKHSEIRAYHDVVIQVSDDPEFKIGVTTIYNNDYDASSPFGKGKDRPFMDSHFGQPVDGMGARGRYVRLYSNGNTFSDANHYAEVEVYGVVDTPGLVSEH